MQFIKYDALCWSVKWQKEILQHLKSYWVGQKRPVLLWRERV